MNFGRGSSYNKNVNNDKNNIFNNNKNSNNKNKRQLSSSSNNININVNLNQKPNYSKISSSLNNYNFNNLNNENSKIYQRIKRKEYKIAKKKELELEKIKKENELENQIKDHLKCYICLSEITKPLMCKYCKRMSCEKCITKWLENKTTCGICKHQVSLQDMIALPFLDSMSTFFMKNIDNRHKKEKINNINNNKNTEVYKKINVKFLQDNKIKKNNEAIKIINKDNNIINNINNVNIDNNTIDNNINTTDNTLITEMDDDKDICIEHGKKIDYYCLQCNKYFCAQCFIFFGKEVNKHNNHLIIKVEKINDLCVNEALDEYNKLPLTKNKLEDLIGKCNAKIRENEIKKYEMIKSINAIRNSFINKIDNDNNIIKNALNYIKKSKNNLNTNYKEIPGQLSYRIDQGNFDTNQKQEIINKLVNINQIDPNVKKDILEQNDNNKKIFVENYQTDFIEINIPRQFHDNDEIINYTLKIIPNYPCKLIFKYFQNKINIFLIFKISDPINSPNYPVFSSYIIFRNNNYGLEFLNLSENNSSINNNNSIEQNSIEKIYSVELDFDKFLYLCNELKIKFKIFITKVFYQ